MTFHPDFGMRALWVGGLFLWLVVGVSPSILGFLEGGGCRRFGLGRGLLGGWAELLRGPFLEHLVSWP